MSTPPQRMAFDPSFYAGIVASRATHKLLETVIVPPFSGRGLVVRQGQLFRIIELEGPQIGDVAVWSWQDRRESFRSLRTWELEGWFLGIHTRLWSDVPWLRPLATCVDETLDSGGRTDDYHHHMVASHCSPEQLELRTGQAGLNACRINLLEAIEPFGLTEDNLGDNIDVFQKTRFDGASGRFQSDRTEATAGDYIEFYAETDLLVAVSVCPLGAVGYPSRMTPLERLVLPLAVEVYETGHQADGRD